jgi:hypothetical protein
VPRNSHAAASVSNWDSYRAETAGFEEQVYFLELQGDAQHRTRALLKNAHGTRGVSLLYRTDQLPCFSIWKNTTAGADGYVTGLEPGTNFPNPRSFEGEQGRVVRLSGGETARFEFGLEYHADAASVGEAERAVVQLQRAEPEVLSSPQPEWCAP